MSDFQDKLISDLEQRLADIQRELEQYESLVTEQERLTSALAALKAG